MVSKFSPSVVPKTSASKESVQYIHPLNHSNGRKTWCIAIVVVTLLTAAAVSLAAMRRNSPGGASELTTSDTGPQLLFVEISLSGYNAATFDSAAQLVTVQAMSKLAGLTDHAHVTIFNIRDVGSSAQRRANTRASSVRARARARARALNQGPSFQAESKDVGVVAFDTEIRPADISANTIKADFDAPNFPFDLTEMLMLLLKAKGENFPSELSTTVISTKVLIRNILATSAPSSLPSRAAITSTTSMTPETAVVPTLTKNPTLASSVPPTLAPAAPTSTPTSSPTNSGDAQTSSSYPTLAPTAQPSTLPSAVLAAVPSAVPSVPSPVPSVPSAVPSAVPSVPSPVPSVPSAVPSPVPSVPSAVPSVPSAVPSAVPSVPSAVPSAVPSVAPTFRPFSWMECSNYSHTIPPQPQPVGFPYSMLPGEKSRLPKSTKHRLLTLKRIVASGCSIIAVARSYDGHDWETIMPQPLEHLDCTSSQCTVHVPEGTELCLVGSMCAYRVDAVDVTASRQLDADQTISRLFQQAAFGPSRSTLASFSTNHGLGADSNAESVTAKIPAWLRKQIDIPPTYLRSYYRQRVNPRATADCQVGRMSSPCELGSRWHRFAFNHRDRFQNMEVSREGNSAGLLSLRVNNILRTQISESIWPYNHTSNHSYVLCEVPDRLYAPEKNMLKQMEISKTGVCDGTSEKSWFEFPNPVINFTKIDTSTTYVFDMADASFVSVDHRRRQAGTAGELDKPVVTLLHSLASPALCSVLPNAGSHVFMRYNESFYAFDPRLVLVDNRIENPAHEASTNTDTADGQCPSVSKSFVNKDSCVRRETCASPVFSSVSVQLNESTLRLWHQLSARHVHYLTNLRLEGDAAVSPCIGKSRWKKVGVESSGGGCKAPYAAAALDESTRATLAAALGASTDQNAFIRDIDNPLESPSAPTNASCLLQSNGTSTIGARIEVAGTDCWEHVHPDTYSIYDFTAWTFKHSGNREAAANGRPNPISQPAENGEAAFRYPSWHDMARWEKERDRSFNNLFAYVGRLGDEVSFSSLPTEVQTGAIARHFGALKTHSNIGFEACGSRAEVANDRTYGNQYHMHQESGRKGSQTDDLKRELDHTYNTDETKGNVWTNVVLKSSDQLRQRVAWALHQVLVIGEMVQQKDEGDPWFAYYDIFVRHAFGNFRDVLREVSYNPMMGKYLTYHQNKALAFSGSFPDENYAREIMQLFSIGLWQLNDDGTAVLESDGEKVATYNNDDVATFARVWTGFDFRPSRSNVATADGRNSDNRFDPMMIKAAWRDRFPKTKLDAGYLGDGYPLCTDLQPQYFLSKGARYKYLGANSAEGKDWEKSWLTDWQVVTFFAPSPATSSLHWSLCGADSTGNCTFPLEVVLNDTLPCDGDECEADRLRSVRVVDAKTGEIVWYESIRPPCVRLTFAANSFYTKESNKRESHQCADPKAAVATVACCDADSGESIETACNFAAEMVTFATAERRCAAKGGVVCETHDLDVWGDRFKRGCGHMQYSWLNTPCSVQVQVHANGWINIVEPQPEGSEGETELGLDSSNTFRVRWDNDIFPTHANGCNADNNNMGSVCTVGNSNSCVCNITVEETAAFTKSTKVPSKAELESTLFVGSLSPAEFNGKYSQCMSDLCVHADGGVKIYNKDRANQLLHFDIDTIFEVPRTLAGSGRTYLRNKVSNVRLGSRFSFRNPPHFMPLLGERFQMDKSYWDLGESIASLDAEGEVEAMIDHLFEHNNMAPFIAHKLIQRFITSNPSPRYVSEVVKAFRTGAYPPAGRTFSSRYGDLGATMAAVLLDREARASTLDIDPAHGKLREPLLQFCHVMRAMEYKPHIGREIALRNMHDKLGMAAFQSPTVFNFYLPDYQPAGPISQAALVSPESQLSTMPLFIKYLNGMRSLVDYGLTTCNYGFADKIIDGTSRKCTPAHKANGDTDKTADGKLTFLPSSTDADLVVSELDLLLTAGRLSSNTKAVASSAYGATILDGGSHLDALKKTQKLILASPEFHTTNHNVDTKTTRPATPDSASLGRPFKALIVISLEGGCDSWSLLVPHSGCKDSSGLNKDFFEEYKTTRTNIAHKKSDVLEVESAEGRQPCTTFGLHPRLEFLQEMYKAGKSAWVANVGSLVEPTTEQQFRDKSVKLPPSLFAHNIQQRLMHNVHAQYSAANGILGRAMAALSGTDNKNGNLAAPYSSQLFSLVGNTKLLEGSPRPPAMINEKTGIERYTDSGLMAALANITRPVSTSLFAESFAQSAESSLATSERLGVLLTNTEVDTSTAFDNQAAAAKDSGVPRNGLSLQLNQVAKVLKLRSELNLERAGFALKLGGFDTHTDVGGTLSALMTDIDESLKIFKDELEAQNLWENVTIVTVSDFGRTLSSNGGGTDHAWGGNHFLLGGALKGGQILGKFPASFLKGDEVLTNRGAVIPTTSWEGLWKGLVEWFGVEEQHMSIVLPNLDNFPSEQLISRGQMFSIS